MNLENIMCSQMIIPVLSEVLWMNPSLDGSGAHPDKMFESRSWMRL